VFSNVNAGAVRSDEIAKACRLGLVVELVQALHQQSRYARADDQLRAVYFDDRCKAPLEDDIATCYGISAIATADDSPRYRYLKSEDVLVESRATD
jgi:hypothetical protein